MSQATFDPGPFDHTALFNLGVDPEGAVVQGVYALIHHFGDNKNNHLQIMGVMRAFRNQVGQWGNHQFDPAAIRDLPLHESRIAQSFIAGIEHLLRRFGDSVEIRYAILLGFHRLENEIVKDGHPVLRIFDRDDDRDGPGKGNFEDGASFGRVKIGSLPDWLYPGL